MIAAFSTTTTPGVDEFLEEARHLYGEVFPCDGKTWDECLRYELGHVLFWFNTPDGSTHVLVDPPGAEA